MAKRGLSTVQRTLNELRKQGRYVEKLEQWISFGKQPQPGQPSGKRRDAFGFIDILAIDPEGIVAIQACGGSSRKQHYENIIENEYVLPWLEAGGTIELWSWSKRKQVRGGSRLVWVPRVDIITLTVVKGEIENGTDKK